MKPERDTLLAHCVYRTILSRDGWSELPPPVSQVQYYADLALCLVDHRRRSLDDDVLRPIIRVLRNGGRVLLAADTHECLEHARLEIMLRASLANKPL